MELASIDDVEQALLGADYLPDRGLATALYLALARSPLLEGEAGVGKTEAAKALASVLSARLIRLQCCRGVRVRDAARGRGLARSRREGRRRDRRRYPPLGSAPDRDEPRGLGVREDVRLGVRGCVESDVFDNAMAVMRDGEPRLLHYGIADEVAWEVGLPCGGEIDVFVEPVE